MCPATTTVSVYICVLLTRPPPKKPSFGAPDARAASHCAQHRHASHVDIRSRRVARAIAFFFLEARLHALALFFLNCAQLALRTSTSAAGASDCVAFYERKKKCVCVSHMCVCPELDLLPLHVCVLN
jgi:hypothetical protein